MSKKIVEGKFGTFFLFLPIDWAHFTANSISIDHTPGLASHVLASHALASRALASRALASHALASHALASLESASAAFATIAATPKSGSVLVSVNSDRNHKADAPVTFEFINPSLISVNSDRDHTPGLASHVLASHALASRALASRAFEVNQSLLP